MSALLFKALQNYINKDMAVFHTPGHRGTLPYDLSLKFDLTELPETDSLFEPEGVLKESQIQAAKVFGAERTLFSAGGCTLCIQTMLRLAAREGDTVIFGRTSHISAVNTASLLGINPVWVYPDGFPGRYDARNIRKALEENQNAKAVFLTNPDYFGCITPVDEIRHVCDEFGVPLLIDRAHGSHLPFLKGSGELISGAAMYADSAHKTLPVLTGGAYLNIFDSRFADDALDAMRLFASTSPSYLILTSLDTAAQYLRTDAPADFEQTAAAVADLRKKAEECGLGILNGPTDPCRLTIETDSGFESAEILRKNGVQPEFFMGNYVTLICTPFNSGEDFKRLGGAIKLLSKKENNTARSDFPKTTAAVSPREAMNAESESVLSADSAGRISAGTAVPCPPGVPLLIPGEIITEEIAQFLQKCSIFLINVLR